MNKFKRKSLCLALATGLCATGVAGTASAVNVNPDGLGQVLIYPYYTVRNGFNTYISVTNTTNYPKAVKVRFLEGKNSREVLDFNLYMSANDMWTGVIVPNDTTGGATLKTSDKSCTAPAIPSAGADFRNAFYSGSVTEGIQYSLSTANNGDGESTSLDRTREGYFEIIEMGMITDTAVTAAITHVSGTPANCAYVQQPSSVMNMGVGGNHALSYPIGGLAGNASLISVATGTDYGYDPTALDNFSNINIWAAPGSINPNLADATPYSTVVNGGDVFASTWYYNEDAVSAVLMHDNIINDYVLDTVTDSGTDWVVTMPTKRYYVPVDNPSNNLAYNAYLPFSSNFWTGGACEPVSLTYYDREEQYVSGIDFSPSTPQGNSLCWESTVITFNNSNLLGSSNSVNVPVNYENGWMQLSFDTTNNYLPAYDGQSGGSYGTQISGPGFSSTYYNVTYYGLPVVGFMLQDFVNGNVGGVLANYGGNFNHKFTTSIYWP